MISDPHRPPPWPSRLGNPPGQRRLHYRLGTHPTFLRRMLEQLPLQAVPDGARRGSRPLRALATREASDPAIALLDAWATVADVVTFYQERIAEEGYLRTADERRSLLELARSVGYELRPGVAASTWLAFEVDDPPGRAVVPVGAQVLSIPGQDERPQTFETVDEIAANAAWNRLRPAPPEKAPARPRDGEEILLAGTATGLRAGDPLLVVGDHGSPRVVTVRTVRPDSARALTRVGWEGRLGELHGEPHVYAFRRRAALFGHDAPDWRTLPEEPAPTHITLQVAKNRFVQKPAGGWPAQWPGFALRPTEIDLDRVYPAVVAESWIVLVNESGAWPCRAARVTTTARDSFTLRGKVTRIVPDADSAGIDPGRFGLRDTVVFAESEELELAEVPRSAALAGDRVDLERVEPAPSAGQALVFAAGELPTDGTSPPPTEVALVDRVEAVPGRPDVLRVVLTRALEHAYDPASAVIRGNAVRATHGETTSETLGSGDASRSHQRFALRGKPLTWLPTPEGGVRGTLEVRVNDVLWHEARSFHGLDAASRAYVVRTGDDGGTTLVFGDGERGARLPSGRENVVATYRVGSGPEGNVPAGSLVLLQTQPLGIRAVTNPLSATGGAPPDDVERARANGPSSVRVLERVVSLRDVETFAGAFPAIGKARAELLDTTGERVVRLTVAGLGGVPVAASTALYRGLEAALDAASEAARTLRIESYTPRRLRIAATVWVEPGHLLETVIDRVRDALSGAFGFDARGFGQGVAASEVIAAAQGVAGVRGVDLDAFHDAESEPALHTHLPAKPTELLLLELEPGDLTAREARR